MEQVKKGFNMLHVWKVSCEMMLVFIMIMKGVILIIRGGNCNESFYIR